MFQIIGKTNIDFVGKRRYTFIFSGIMALVGLIALISISLGKANLGIDFGGGIAVQGNFKKQIDIGDLRSAMSKSGYTDVFIQELKREAPNSYLIRLKTPPTGETNKVGEDILRILKQEFPDNDFTQDSIDEVGPAVGKMLQKQARLAVLLAFAGILIYIWIRFDFRFGVAATIATLHDVLAILGIIFILQKEITLLVITALLTLAGYSLTDKVVVFDRIRENLKLFRKRGSFPDTVNSSINEVLARTIVTSATTLFAALAIFLVGGEVTRDFALALVLGIAVGTYSSIFVASPIVVEWELKSPKRFK